jgi:hypothetical protein
MIFAGCRLTANKLALLTLCVGTKKVTSARCQSGTFLSSHFDTKTPHKLAFLTLRGHPIRLSVSYRKQLWDHSNVCYYDIANANDISYITSIENQYNKTTTTAISIIPSNNNHHQQPHQSMLPICRPPKTMRPTSPTTPGSVDGITFSSSSSSSSSLLLSALSPVSSSSSLYLIDRLRSMREQERRYAVRADYLSSSGTADAADAADAKSP